MPCRRVKKKEKKEKEKEMNAATWCVIILLLVLIWMELFNVRFKLGFDTMNGLDLRTGLNVSAFQNSPGSPAMYPTPRVYPPSLAQARTMLF
jgi:hypothetical protein